MYSRILVATACVGVAGLLAGCGRQPANNPPPPNFAVAPADADVPVIPAPEDVPAAEGERPRRFEGPALKSFQEVLAGLPKDKQPKPGPEAIIERNEAKEWLAENALGKAIEFTLQVRAIDIHDMGDGKYRLDLLIGADPKTEETKRFSEGIRADNIKIGDVPCQVRMRGPSPMWTDLDSPTARKYRDLKNKQVVFQGIIDAAEFQESDRPNELIFNILVVDPVPVRSDSLPPQPAAPKGEPPWRIQSRVVPPSLHGRDESEMTNGNCF